MKKSTHIILLLMVVGTSARAGLMDTLMNGMQSINEASAKLSMGLGQAAVAGAMTAGQMAGQAAQVKQSVLMAQQNAMVGMQSGMQAGMQGAGAGIAPADAGRMQQNNELGSDVDASTAQAQQAAALQEQQEDEQAEAEAQDDLAQTVVEVAAQLAAEQADGEDSAS